MNEVPTTQTFADKQKEIKELSEKVAVLRSLKDTAERETKGVVEAADAAVARYKTIESDIEEARKVLDTVIEETDSFIVYCTAIMREVMQPMEKTLELYKQIASHTEESSKSLIDIEKKGIDIHKETVKDFENLHIAMADLNIYRGRIEEYYAKHFPDQKVIL